MLWEARLGLFTERAAAGFSALPWADDPGSLVSSSDGLVFFRSRAVVVCRRWIVTIRVGASRVFSLGVDGGGVPGSITEVG